MKQKEYLIPLTPVIWKKAAKRRDDFSHLYLARSHGDALPFKTPVEIEVTFYMPWVRERGIRKNGTWHAAPPNVDGLLRFLFNCIKQAENVLCDERLVSSLKIKKVQDAEPRTHMIIRELET